MGRFNARQLRVPESSFYNSGPPSAAELVSGFVAFNPHARFTVDGHHIERTATTWEKWSPDQPTSAHWYGEETLRDLIAAYIANGEKTVREFVSEFRGISSSAKQTVVSEGWSGKRLSDFVVDGDVDPSFVVDILRRMQDASTPPPPSASFSIPLALATPITAGARILYGF